MKLFRCYLFLPVFLFLSSCVEKDTSVSQEEMAKGLKSALDIGVNYALNSLGSNDGFLKDQTVKIFLPDEANDLIKKTLNVPIFGDLVKKAEDQVIISINRAAENSIKEVVPIVLEAIQTMTIQDAQSILFSSSDIAATQYLKDKSYQQLSEVCQSIIRESLSKEIAGISAQDAWERMITQYNKAANILSLSPIETDLTLYTTQKTLDGVFFKVEKEEQNIRVNASARVNDILKKVFGLLD